MFEQKNFKFTLKAVFPLIFSSMSSNSENKQIFSEIQPSNIRDMVKNQVSGDTTIMYCKQQTAFSIKQEYLARHKTVKGVFGPVGWLFFK